MEHCHIDYYTCSNSMFITEIFEDMATVLQVQLFWYAFLITKRPEKNFRTAKKPWITLLLAPICKYFRFVVLCGLS